MIGEVFDTASLILEDENGKKQFILKDLLDKGIYLVKAEFDQGTVEYGFEVKKSAKSS